MSDRVLARIGKPHGIRGEVTVQAHTDDPAARFVPGATFATEAPPGSGVPRVLTISAARLHRDTWLLAFEEVPDRTGAEGLRGTRLVLDDDAGADALDGHRCSMWIDGEKIAEGGVGNIPGGPLRSLAELLNHLGRAGDTLPAGTLITTGAATGVHQVSAGQRAVADFGADGRIVVDMRGAAA